MTASTTTTLPLPDAAARRRIAEDLDANLLVEAGAGAGKTTAMVGRMVALVATGRAAVERIAAVTFTRKAAAELRERFQVALERALRRAREDGDDDVARRLDAALRDIDRGFIGTIHSFCARLLRERPIEAGLDPGFREVFGPEEARLRRAFWARHLERLALDGHASLETLERVGLRPALLYRLFEELSDNLDVAFPAAPVERPDPAGVRRGLEALLDRAEPLLPREEPDPTWDALQSKIRSLRFQRRVLDWRADDRVFFDALADLLGLTITDRVVTLKRWSPERAVQQEVKELRDAFGDFCADGGPARALLDRWLEHRYPAALGFALDAARAWADERRRTGHLNFQDLLLGAAKLLREHDGARRELGERFRYLLVDEFQDTDPIQAEVLLLLAGARKAPGAGPAGAEGAGPADARRAGSAEPHGAGAAGARPPDWRAAVPRPGALFVVGDPKQSIYRFRRADIAIYNQVKARFLAWESARGHDFAGVVELVANFRSRPPIGHLVNAVFPERFPERATAHQAAFAPLLPQQPDAEPQGAFRYEVAPTGRSKDAVAGADAEAVASWIAERVARGERAPGDFLVLTTRREPLAVYARALEARNIPVQVTGAGVGVAEELDELLRLLRALADPGDASLTVAALVGLFFGLDYEALTAHALAGGTFDLREAAAAPERPAGSVTPDASATPAQPATPVAEALATLRRWWALVRAEPADVAVARIVEELGLLPYAAAGELGATRAGALLYALEAVRAAAREGETSLTGAVAALEAALETDDAEAPLEPGRADAVRVMNLHKAKGLEADVVVLAFPTGQSDHEPARHVARPEHGDATGWVLARPPRELGDAVLAQPRGWAEYAEREKLYEAAEDDRLLYVAATRPRHELVVARCAATEAKSPWAPLYPWLEAHGTRLDLAPTPRPERAALETPAAEIRQRVDAVDRDRDARARPGYAVRSVTARVKGDGGQATARADGADAADAPPDASARGGAGTAGGGGVPNGDGFARGAGMAGDEGVPGGGGVAGGAGATAPGRRSADPGGGAEIPARDAPRGAEWGTAVHGALEAAARGAESERLRAVCRGLLIEADRPTTADGEPVELDELVTLVEAMLASPLWQRARRARSRLVEASFAVALSPGTAAAALDDAPVQIVEGTIDLVFREADGWVIVDYKTDALDDPAVRDRRVAVYRRQVDLYALCWERLTGEPVKERRLVLTRYPDRDVVW